MILDDISKDVEWNDNASIEVSNIFGFNDLQRKNDPETDMRKIHYIFRLRQRPILLRLGNYYIWLCY